MTQARLLIIHHGALGDVVATFSAVIRLRQRFRRIDALFQDMLGRLAAELNVVDKCYALEAASFATLYAEPVDLFVKHFLHTYDNIIIFSHSLQLKETINKITGKKVSLIPPRPDVDQNVHIAWHILTNLVTCGLIDETDSDHNLIRSSDLPADGKAGNQDPAIVLIHPGSGSRKKNWNVSSFIKTAEMLESDGMQTEFMLGPADIFLADSLSVPKKHKRKVHIIDDLKKLVVLLKTAGGFIGNDSGIGHLAAFLDLPTLTVFGPSDPQRWRPVGRITAAVRPELECRPCFEIKGTDCETMECLTATTPEMVVEVFCGLIGKKI